MLYWECKRRLQSLRRFRQFVLDYFSNVSPDRLGRFTVENQVSQTARNEINLRMGDNLHSCQLVREDFTVYYSPPPLIGGLQGPVNLLGEMFGLWRLRIPWRTVVDKLDRAIGNYERSERWLYWQMFNPLFWLHWLLTKLLSIPFEILTIAGFEGARAEKSLPGKVFKVVGGLFVFLAALLTVLDYLDLLESVKKLLNSR